MKRSGHLNYLQLDPEQCEFVQVAPVSELPNGERIFLQIDAYSIVLFNIAGTYYAIEDICSHDNGPLGEGDLEGYQIICPRHGARFDVRTGKVLSLPAVEDIPAYPTRVVGDQIEVGVPLE